MARTAESLDEGIVLRTDKLSKSFGGIQAVDNLDFTIEKNEIVAIIGPNGSGKTTFFNLIMHLYDASAGAIYFGASAINLLDYPSHQINAIGIARTFQTLRLFPNLTVIENILVGMSTRLRSGFFGALFRPPRVRREEHESEERALEVLSFFGHRLLSMCNEPAASLSYANRRRLEIARAIASEPKLLLLDEPVAGMNPTETREVMEDIERLNQKGYTVLLIEHDMTLVEGVAQRVVAFDHGAKIAEGSFQEVCENPEVIEAYLGRGARKRQ
jgi:ABC-type branched-subunit amino acid transport system ATPase component